PPRNGVGTGERAPARARLVVEALGVVRLEARIGLHDEAARMQREPLRQRHLLAGNLPERRPLLRPRHGMPRRLPPPAVGRPVLEQGVEVIYADQAKRLGAPVDYRIENAAGAADRAVAHEHRASADGVAHLVVIPDELERIRPRLAVPDDTNHETRR